MRTLKICSLFTSLFGILISLGGCMSKYCPLDSSGQPNCALLEISYNTNPQVATITYTGTNTGTSITIEPVQTGTGTATSTASAVVPECSLAVTTLNNIPANNVPFGTPINLSLSIKQGSPSVAIVDGTFVNPTGGSKQETAYFSGTFVGIVGGPSGSSACYASITVIQPPQPPVLPPPPPPLPLTAQMASNTTSISIAVDQAKNPLPGSRSSAFHLSASSNYPGAVLATIGSNPPGISCDGALNCTLPAPGSFNISGIVTANGQAIPVSLALSVSPIYPASVPVYRFFGQRPKDLTYAWYYSTNQGVPPYTEEYANLHLEGAAFAVFPNPTPVCNSPVTLVHSISRPSYDDADVLFNSAAAANSWIAAYVPNGWGPANIEATLGYTCLTELPGAPRLVHSYGSQYSCGVTNFSNLVSITDDRPAYGGLPTPDPGGPLIWTSDNIFGYSP